MIWNVINSVGVVIGLYLTVMNMKRTKEMDRIRRRPVILFQDKHVSSDLQTQYGLYFRNAGESAAINVDIPDEYINKYPFFAQWRVIRRDMGPGDETMCASGPTVFVPQIENLVIHYEDTEGNKYSTVFENGQITLK